MGSICMRVREIVRDKQMKRGPLKGPGCVVFFLHLREGNGQWTAP